ncbi:ABC transporter substrate-binding protein [Paracoccus yeei]|uniref:ABC transporter substrate-binding protein n=1 Tax=Paracoccus yeei TaxID=147645 RepID=UPI003BF8A9E9
MTARELDVLTLLAAGCSNDNIAARLAVSPRTVAKHVEHLSAKLGVWSRSQMAGLALDCGLLHLPVPGGADGLTLAPFRLDQAETALSWQATRSRQQPILRPIHIGLPYPVSGRGSLDAVEMVNGAALAVAEVNDRGGIHGRQVRLAPKPFHSRDNDAALAAYRALVEQEVEAVTAGYACYSPQVHDLIGDARLPYLHAATLNHAVERVRDSRLRLGNIFQSCASDINYAQGLLRFVAGLGPQMTLARRLAIVVPKTKAMDMGMAALAEGLDQQGWQLQPVAVDTTEPDCWQRVVTGLHRLKPGVVTLASFFVEDAIPFQRAFLENPVRALVYLIYSPSAPCYRQELGTLSEGVIWATTSGLYTDMIGMVFRQRYFARYSSHPGNSQAGLAYDRVGLLLGSWQRAGHPRAFDKVIADLRTSINRGVNGSYYFGNDGQVGLAYPDDTLDLSISQAHLIHQLQQGRNVVLAPDPYASGSLNTPPGSADRPLSDTPREHHSAELRYLISIYSSNPYFDPSRPANRAAGPCGVAQQPGAKFGHVDDIHDTKGHCAARLWAGTTGV